jgi:nitroimidazol reductase NimA-like FMN-containing flavoprotein (pyridoxamine 5'-phosphate oxidase superfamily)
MPNLSPATSLDARYSEENAKPTPWPDAVTHLERAGLFWVSSVRADGRPHVTPVVAVWMDGALYFSSGQASRSRRTWRPINTVQ